MRTAQKTKRELQILLRELYGANTDTMAASTDAPASPRAASLPPRTVGWGRATLQRVLDRALPQPCFFCRDSSAESVCTACANALVRVPPHACPRCLAPSANGDVCGRCIKRPPIWQHLHALWLYDFPTDALILAIKYGHAFALCRWAAAQCSAWPYAATATLVPVPLAAARHQFRGYNQSELIARDVARRFALRTDTEALIRVRETEVQQQLDLVGRRRNVRAAFAATRSLAGESIVLVDDVMTSGSTLNEMARAAYAAGAARVDAFVLARVKPLRARERIVTFRKSVA